MPRKLTARTSNSTPAPAGIHNARVYRIVDLGTQKQEFNGNTKEFAMISVSYELVDTMHAFDPEKPKEKKPFTVHQDYTYVLSPKSKLQKMIESMLNIKIKPKDEIDVYNKLLGKPCQVQVIHKESKDGTKTYANVENVFAPNPKAKVKELFNETCILDLDDFDKEIFLALPPFMQEKIKKSPEFSENVLMTGSLAEDPAEQRAKKGGAGKTAAKKGKK
jgi:hypothetical protein